MTFRNRATMFRPTSSRVWLSLLAPLAMIGCTDASEGIQSPVAWVSSAQHGSCAYPATLEITHINIGQGDATLIATPSALVLADVGESYWNSHIDADTIDGVITGKYGCRTLDYVVVSHLQVDHVGYVGYGGLWYLVNTLGYDVGETLFRDYNANVGTTSGTYDNWVVYLASPEGQAALNPRVATLGEQLDLGAGITLTITNVDTRTASCPNGWGSKADLSCGGDYVVPSEVLGDHRGDYPAPSENDYCVGFVVAVGDFDIYIGGDTDGENLDNGFGTAYHDVESYLGGDVGEVDVLRVNHHGSAHSTNASFMADLDPQAVVVSVGSANTYGHARQETVDRVLGVVGGNPTRSVPIYMTERGDDGIGGCQPDYSNSDKAAAQLYGWEVVVSDTDGDYCTIEGGDVDIVVAADGSTFTIEGTPYTSAADSINPCDNDGVCEEGEDCVDCPNDCATASGAECGNGICEAGDGEDCVGCPEDCNGKQDGKPSNRFCCGDGDGQNPVSCSDSRCTSGGYACDDAPAPSWCCGDAACDPAEVCELDCGPLPFCGDSSCDANEDSCSCSADCGAPPAGEVVGATCDDGADNDCDGLVDCQDSDCAAEPVCAPPACDGDGICEAGEDCLSCASDCDGEQKGNPANRYCCGDGEAQSAEGDGSICDGQY